MRLLFWRPRPEDEEAVAQARRELDEVNGRWPEVREKAEAVRQHREVNGFTALLIKAMGVDR